MRYRPIQAASQERVPIALWGQKPLRRLLTVVTASAVAFTPAMMIGSPAQAVDSPSNINNVTVGDAGNWEGGSVNFKVTYTGTGPGTYSFAFTNTSPDTATGAAGASATDGSEDYDNTAPSNYTFPGTASGQSNTVTISVPTVADSDDSDETFTLVVKDTNNWTKTAAGTIWAVADADYGTYTLKAPTAATAETATKNSSGATVQKTVRITATLTNPLPHPVWIPVSTMNGGDGVGASAAANSNKGEFRDFDALPAGTMITIPAYSYSGYVDVMLYDDAVHETATQYFSVVPGTTYGLAPYDDSSTMASAIDDQTKKVGIADDDAKPSVSIADAPENAVEGDYLTFPVTLSAPSELPVYVKATASDGTKRADSNAATSGDDFTAIVGSGSGRIDIPQYTKGGFASVPTKTDSDFEGPENVKVTLTSLNDPDSTIGTPAMAYGVIDDANDGPDVSLTSGYNSSGVATPNAGTYLPEGSTGEVVKKLKVKIPDTGMATQWPIPIKIDYAFKDGTATNGVDYKGASGTINIPANTAPGSTLEIPVTIVGDTISESPDETFDVVLTSSTKTIQPVDTTFTILEGSDDKLPSYSVGNVTVVEGNTGTVTAKVPVTLSGPAGGDVIFDTNISGGSATEGGSNSGTTVGDDDYDLPASSTLTIKAGQTVGWIEIPVKGDTVYEQDETITVAPTVPNPGTVIDTTLVPGTVQTAAVTITNDDAAPKITWNNLTGTEGSILRVNGAVEGLSQYPYSVDFKIAAAATDGATPGKDFDAPDVSTYTLNVARGKDGQLSTLLDPPFPADVYLTPDTIDEATEAFTITAKESTPSPKGFTTSVGTYKITDDPADLPPVVSISDESIGEDEGSVDVHVKLTQVGDTTATEQTIKVPYWTADGSAKAGQDYTETKGVLSIAPGVTETYIKVPITDDKYKEGNENFWVKLGTPEWPYGAKVGKAVGEVIIKANDGGSGDDTEEPGPGNGGDAGAPTLSVASKILGARTVMISGKADAGATVDLYGAPMSDKGDLKKLGETKADSKGSYSFSRAVTTGYRFATGVGELYSEESMVWVQQVPVFVASSPSKGKLSLAVQGNPRGAKQTVIVQRWSNGAWVNAWRGMTGANGQWKATVNQKSKSAWTLRAFVAGYTPDGLLPGYTANKRVVIK